jgi:acyl-CoA synthetase (AMP-forming)/AMP-acid ligase II
MGSGAAHDPGQLARRAAHSTVASLFRGQAAMHPDRVAIRDGERELRYGELDERSGRLAAALLARGVQRGDRVAVLSENRAEVLELYLAAARLGAIVACQSFRLATPELAHCLRIVEPSAALTSPRWAGALAAAGGGAPIVFGDDYERTLAGAAPGPELRAAEEAIDPEDPLLILYTSGTTGLPKGAVLSHRAEVVRNLVVRAEFGVAPRDTFVAWSPLYHMGAAECSLGALMAGGMVSPAWSAASPRC